MKAITLTQPWASLVALGLKKIETRSWGTSYRGPLAIHAAKGFPRQCREFHEEMAREYAALGHQVPLGAVIATCRLVAAGPMVELSDGRWCVRTPGGIRPVPEEEEPLGDYALNRFGWFLEDVTPLPEPVPARGALGLWEWRP